MTPRKPRPHKKRGVRKGTKLTDQQKKDKAAHTVKNKEVCPKCGNIIPGHKLTCPTLKLPRRGRRE